jgi:hypothetical protein
MKKNIFKAFALVILFVLAACEGDVLDSMPKKNGSIDQKIMPIRFEIERVQALIYQALAGIDQGEMDGGRRAAKSIESAIQEYAPCGETSIVEETEESVQITLDFGDGCQIEDGPVVFGKMTIKLTFTEEGEYSFETELVDYKVIYEESGDSEFEMKPVTINGKSIGTNGGSENLFTYKSKQQFHFKYEDGSTLEYSSDQYIENDDDGFRISKFDMKGSLSNGDTFETSVIKTLVSSFSCGEDIYTYVAGVERMTYNGKTVEIDYGNGECDNEYTTR